MPRDLHSALKVEQIGDATGGGVRFLVVRLQYGKEDFSHSVHADPQMFFSSGVQTADYLGNLGFNVSDCAFLSGNCLVRPVAEGFDVSAFATAFESAWGAYKGAGDHLSACGLVKARGEGEWGGGDGHTATK